MFQSLFYWNCRLIVEITRLQAYLIGFNPCFIGIAVWSSHTDRWFPGCLQVSILVLLELPFDLCFIEMTVIELKEFQSLFYWNCRLICKVCGHVWLARVFQSLFYWNCRLIGCAYRSSSRLRGVSILVLLELPFDLIATVEVYSVSLSFNPCFIGIAVWSSIPTRHTRRSRGFNPCFIGIAVWSHPGSAQEPEGYRFQSLFYWNCRLILRR